MYEALMTGRVAGATPSLATGRIEDCSLQVLHDEVEKVCASLQQHEAQTAQVEFAILSEIMSALQHVHSCRKCYAAAPVLTEISGLRF